MSVSYSNSNSLQQENPARPALTPKAVAKPADPAPATSWRNILPVHPAAELFPRMSPDELCELGEDMLENGVTSPIALWRADPKAQLQMLDGINRLDAIELVTGCPVEVGPPSLMAGDFLATDKVIVLDKTTDPYAYVISANIHRRHLNTGQKRELIARVLKADPNKSDRQIAANVKASPTTVGTPFYSSGGQHHDNRNT
jgi:hypothetical protein